MNNYLQEVLRTLAAVADVLSFPAGEHRDTVSLQVFIILMRIRTTHSTHHTTSKSPKSWRTLLAGKAHDK